MPAGGRDSREKGNMPFLPVVRLAGRLRRDIAEFPGGHVGYAEQHPAKTPFTNTRRSTPADLARLRGTEVAWTGSTLR